MALLRALDDELCAHGEVSELKRVGRHEIAEVVVADLLAERLDAVRGAGEALVRAHDTYIVPHEAADFVPHVRDENGLVWRNGVADAPCGDLGQLPARRELRRVRREPCRREPGADERFHKRVGRKAVRAVKTGAGALPDGGESRDGSLARSRRLDAAAGVVRRRHDRDQVLRHVDAELHALLVDVRETRHQVGPALLPDVEVHARCRAARGSRAGRTSS